MPCKKYRLEYNYSTTLYFFFVSMRSKLSFFLFVSFSLFLSGCSTQDPFEIGQQRNGTDMGVIQAIWDQALDQMFWTDTISSSEEILTWNETSQMPSVSQVSKTISPISSSAFSWWESVNQAPLSSNTSSIPPSNASIQPINIPPQDPSDKEDDPWSERD